MKVKADFPAYPATQKTTALLFWLGVSLPIVLPSLFVLLFKDTVSEAFLRSLFYAVSAYVSLLVFLLSILLVFESFSGYCMGSFPAHSWFSNIIWTNFRCYGLASYIVNTFILLVSLVCIYLNIELWFSIIG